MLSDELPFTAGDFIQVLDSGSGPLWYGACRQVLSTYLNNHFLRNRTGWFPKTYVNLRAHDSNNALTVADNTRFNSTLIACNTAPDEYPKSMRYLRRKVVEELMNTERDYVALLHNLVEVN